VLLTTTGAKTGETRVNPMMYRVEEGTIYVFASKAGAPTNPDWYHNLVANPKVKAEIGTETFDATARVITGSDRDEVYARPVEAYPGFGEYQKKTTRIIPVVALDRS
jgi:deazaflavin-dependent oxidoreductase (nitroreductase family)